MCKRKHRHTDSGRRAETDDRESSEGERDELLATLHELYGRASEVAGRVLQDARALEAMHVRTSAVLDRLRNLPSAPRRIAHVPPTPTVAPPMASGPRLPRLISFREVYQRTSLSRSTVWRMERAGQFPARRRLSVNKVAWWEPEIEEWVGNRLDRQVK